MTASQLPNVCDIPLSTVYRKRDLLTGAGLLGAWMQLRTDGHHTAIHEVAFEEGRISLSRDRDFEVEVAVRDRTPDECLVELWSQVRGEA